MALTDAAVRKAEPRDKPYKMADSGGLYLYVAPTGLKSWRMKFKVSGSEKLLTFGTYPGVKLTEARDKRDDARKQLRDGSDPSGVRRKAEEAREAERAAAAQLLTFEQAARRWWELQRGRWAPVHAADVIASLERDVFPTLGKRALVSIKAPDVLTTLRLVEDRGSIETAKRLRQRIAAVYDMHKSEGVTETNPAAGIGKALKPLPTKGRQPALTDPDEARQVLIAAEASGASPITKLASRFLALTQSRPGMVRGVTWDEIERIDWTGERYGPDLPVWRVPAARMKLVMDLKGEETFEHVIPLCWQAVDVLRTMHRLTGRNRLIFPGQRHSHRPLSENAIGYLYNRVGYHGRHVPHGWRSSFSTTMNGLAVRQKRLGDEAVIELMLAHVPENKVKAAYDRSGHMERRRELSQEWADLLLKDMAPAATLMSGRRR
ncbi:integrase arm-type DNA-binding domain-containing protein [Sphingomonas sp. BK235]|uniref:tyrosine-type recombinase/integrase n=1 Tax=Sphingomonas sp. BK235 TaxID=2512131 RepID=UPI0010529E68|nr:integrase arm-type DNA-binding domain-containing protein [Sphingomonas sp. BK235]TCP36520.1 integrase [Sphingomonas sp. BK235]